MLRKLLIVLFTILATSAMATPQIDCLVQKNVPADDEGLSLYVCSNGTDKFKAKCDGSTDAEFATPPVEKAVWTKVGDTEGIEFEGGSVACTKVK